MLIENVRKSYQEAIKAKKDTELEKNRKNQAVDIINKAVGDSIHAAKELKTSISFTFGAHPVTAKFAIDGLQKEGFNVTIVKVVKESALCEMNSLTLSGWAGSEKNQAFNEKVKELGILATDQASPYNFENAKIIQEMIREANKDVDLKLDAELWGRAIRIL